MTPPPTAPAHPLLDRVGPVVVAVGPDGADAAVRFAAATAVRRGVSLHVLHVFDLQGSVGQVEPLGAEATPSAQDVLWEAVVRARSLVDGRVHVASELAHGAVVARILAASRDADLLVVQRRARPGRTARRTGTCPHVVGAAVVPVVCVPWEWDGGRGAGVVTVGVDDPLTCGPLVRQALLAASRLGARLQVLHVEWGGGTSARRLLQVALAEGVAEVPGVDTSVKMLSGDAVEVLLRLAYSCELLVVGRHHPHHPHGSRLGPVARSLVRRAACPVLLPTPSESVSSGEWVFETRMA